MMATAQLQREPSCLEPTRACSDQSTRQTVAIMARHIARAVNDPAFQHLAHQVGADPERIFWYVKHTVRFRSDEEAVLSMFNERDQVDLLIEPRLLVQHPHPAGDCDEFTMLVCALLQANGQRWEIVTLACDRSRLGLWSHVFPRVVLPNGRRLSLDAANGDRPGWQVPAYDISRKQVWGMDGRPIADLRLHGFVRARRRGMGQADWTAEELAAGAIIMDDGSVVLPNGTFMPGTGGTPSNNRS